MKRSNFLRSLIILPFLPKVVGAKPVVNTERIVFTPDMLNKGHGLYIIRAGVDPYTHKRVGYAATVSWKICYRLGHYVKDMTPNQVIVKDLNEYGIVNFLTDGFFHPISYDKVDVCNYLNSHTAGFRPLTKEEVLYMIEQRQQGFL